MFFVVVGIFDIVVFVVVVIVFFVFVVVVFLVIVMFFQMLLATLRLESGGTICKLDIIDHLLIGEVSWVNLVVVNVWLPLVQGLVIISLSPKTENSTVFYMRSNNKTVKNIFL